MNNRNNFEDFWIEKQDLLGSISKETAEIIWNSAVVSTVHDFISLNLSV